MTKKAPKENHNNTSSNLGSNLSKKRNELTYVEKEEALKLMNEGKATPQTLATRYGCGVRQFQKLKQKGLPKSNFGLFKKRNRDPDYKEVVALTIKDCDNHRALGQPLSGLMISGYAAHNAETIKNDTSGLYSDEVKAKYLKATFGESFVKTFKTRFQY